MFALILLPGPMLGPVGVERREFKVQTWVAGGEEVMIDVTSCSADMTVGAESGSCQHIRKVIESEPLLYCRREVLPILASVRCQPQFRGTVTLFAIDAGERRVSRDRGFFDGCGGGVAVQAFGRSWAVLFDNLSRLAICFDRLLCSAE